MDQWLPSIREHASIWMNASIVASCET